MAAIHFSIESIIDKRYNFSWDSQQQNWNIYFCILFRHNRVKLKCFGTWETQWHFCWGPQRKVVCSSSIGHIQAQSCIQKLTTKDSKSYVEKQIAFFLSVLLKIQKNSWKLYIKYSHNFYLNNINTSHKHLLHSLLFIIDDRKVKEASIIEVMVNYRGYGLTLQT